MFHGQEEGRSVSTLSSDGVSLNSTPSGCAETGLPLPSYLSLASSLQDCLESEPVSAVWERVAPTDRVLASGPPGAGWGSGRSRDLSGTNSCLLPCLHGKKRLTAAYSFFHNASQPGILPHTPATLGLSFPNCIVRGKELRLLLVGMDSR